MARIDQNNPYQKLVASLETAACEYEKIALDSTTDCGALNIHFIARCVNRANALRSQAHRISLYQSF